MSWLLTLAMVIGLMPGMSLTAKADDYKQVSLTYDSYDYSVTAEQRVDEGNLFDNKTDTKWAVRWPGTEGCTNKDISLIFHAPSSVVVTKYEIVTGDDTASYSERNPKAWTLYGSDSASGPWIAIDTKTSGNYLPAENHKATAFSVSNSAAYQYYKFTVTEVGNVIQWNSYYVQLSELRLFTNSAAVTGVSLDKESTTMTVGGSETLTATISPDVATNKNVTWASSDTAVATVSSKGVIKGVSKGKAKIYAYAQNGVAKVITVTIK